MYTNHIRLQPNAHILVVKLAGIGDLLLATPALRALRESYPQATIDLLVTPASAGLLNDWGIINRVMVLDKYLFDHPKQLVTRPQNLSRLLSLWRTLRSGHYDAVLLMHHLTLRFGRLKYHMLMRATGARWLVGLDNGHGWFLNVRVPDKGFGAMHEADYALALALAVGSTISSRKLFVPLTEEERQQAHRLVYGNESRETGAHPIIAIHPGSGSYSTARRWSPDRFAELADTLYQEAGGQLLLVGGPEEVELHQYILSKMQSQMPARSLAGQGSIKVAAAVIEQADLFIGNDSGLMHLAVAVGTPTVAIFGLTNHRAWGPYTGENDDEQQSRAIIARLGLPCMPCFYRGHKLGTPEGCATRDCLKFLSVYTVAAAARKMLRFWQERQQQEIGERSNHA
jgi:lipopolysaccharide heptosyltransferase II